MAIPFTLHLQPKYIIFDCIDDLSAFKFATKELKDFEQKLLSIADIVFTGGNALYEFKKIFHQNIYSFPSCIDKQHFGSARNINFERDDQINIPHPRLRFFRQLASFCNL